MGRDRNPRILASSGCAILSLLAFAVMVLVAWTSPLLPLIGIVSAVCAALIRDPERDRSTANQVLVVLAVLVTMLMSFLLLGPLGNMGGR